MKEESIPFSNIGLHSRDGLISCELTDLGKINVICGSNNSGKTTLLQTIADPYACSAGIRISYEEVESAYVMYYLRRKITINKQPVDESIKVRRKALFEKIYEKFIKDRVLYSNEMLGYAEATSSIWKSEGLSEEYNSETEANVFSSFFKKKNSFILIPPKRSLELSTKIDPKTEVSSSGEGILYRLFFCKNQTLGSHSRVMYEEMCKAFEHISGGYAFDILMSMETLSLTFKSNNNQWIHAEKCGLGLHDLIVLLYFSIFSDANVILVEEPESHIHPDMQRKLLQYFYKNTTKQYFLTTHSNVFLNTTFVDKVFFTQFTDSIEVSDETSRSRILHSLGYSVNDNLVPDLIILTEGPKDRIVLEYFLSLLDLDGFDIKIWPLGGDIMHTHDLSVFSESHNIVALIDNDPKSGHIRKKFEQNCEEFRIPVHKLGRYAIENYYPLHVLRDVFKDQISPSITKIEPNIKLKDQIGMDVKNNTEKIVNRMTVNDIEGTDLMEFFELVKSECKKKL